MRIILLLLAFMATECFCSGIVRQEYLVDDPKVYIGDRQIVTIWVYFPEGHNGTLSSDIEHYRKINNGTNPTEATILFARILQHLFPIPAPEEIFQSIDASYANRRQYSLDCTQVNEFNYGFCVKALTVLQEDTDIDSITDTESD